MQKPASAQQTKPKPNAPALARGLGVLELLATSKEPQGLTAIARHLDIANSSTHAICATLMDEGYIEKRSDGSFHLTLKVLNLACSKIQEYDVVERFHEVCDEIPLIQEIGATIAVLDGPDVYFIGVRNRPQPLGIAFTVSVGMRLPACCTATGRALLANLSDEEVCERYPDEDLPQVTDAGLKTRTELLEMLKAVRINGYSEEIAGLRAHMHSFGALVATPSGVSIAGVAVSMYDDIITDELRVDAIDSIRALANRLSQFTELLV